VVHLRSPIAGRLTTRSGPSGPNPWSRVRLGATVLVLILAVGVVGYRILGLGLFDAVYQTGITVTTVGFEETGPAGFSTHSA